MNEKVRHFFMFELHVLCFYECVCAHLVYVCVCLCVCCLWSEGEGQTTGNQTALKEENPTT